MEATLEPAVVEDQAVETPEPIAPDTESVVEAPVEQPEAVDDSDIQDYLKTSGLATPEAGSDSETEPEDEWRSLLKELPEDKRGKFEELIAERETAQEQQRTQRTQAQRERFSGRIKAIADYLAPVVNGEKSLTLQDIQALQNHFNNHHSDSLALAQEDVAESFKRGLVTKGLEALPASSREALKDAKFETSSDFTKAVITEARKGYVTEKQAKEQAQQTLKGYKQYLVEKKLLPSTRTAEVSLNGATTPQGRAAEDELLANPNTPIETVNKILARRNGQ